MSSVGGGWVGGDQWDFGDSAGPAPLAPRPSPTASRVAVQAICCPTCSSLAVRIRTSSGTTHVLECGDCLGRWKEVHTDTIVRALVLP